MFEFKFESQFIQPDWNALQTLFLRLHLSSPASANIPTTEWAAYPHPFLWGEELRKAELPWQESTDKVVEELCTTGTAQTESKEVAYFLSLRVETVSYYLISMTVSAGEHGMMTIIPFPEMSPLRAARWFLIPWWRSHGRAQAGRSQLMKLLERLFQNKTGNA
jgi:hypothetical protein